MTASYSAFCRSHCGAAAVCNLGGFQSYCYCTSKFCVLRRGRRQCVLPAKRIKLCVHIRRLLLQLGGQWLAVRHGLLWPLVSIALSQLFAAAAGVRTTATDLSLPTLFLLVAIQSGALVSGKPSTLVVSASCGHGALPDMAISRDSLVPWQAVLSWTHAPNLPPPVSSPPVCRANNTRQSDPHCGSSSIQAGSTSRVPPTCAPLASTPFRPTANSAHATHLSSAATTAVSPGCSSSVRTPCNPPSTASK